ncbi:hypothetical protein HDU91_002873, partial [Kappamyces sp. JEL0680]
ILTLAYEAKHGKSFEKVIKSEFNGSLEKVLVAFIEAVEDYPTFLAKRFEKSMAGLGTNEKKLDSLTIRTKFFGLMEPVKAAYLRKYGKTLFHRVKGEVSGDHERMLLAIIGEN